MSDISKLRSEIDQIHQQMALLFQKRLDVAEKIWELKKLNQLPMLDSVREDLIIHQFDEALSNSEERLAMQNFMRSLLAESKRCLEARLK